MTLENFKNGHRCPKCSHGSIKYTLDEYNDKFNQNIINKNNFKVISIYNNFISGSRKAPKAIFECKHCHEQIERKMLYALNNNLVCKSCAKLDSIFVYYFKKFLIENNYIFTKEKTFEMLKNDDKNSLRFDFFIENIMTGIEIDGQQHFSGTFLRKR